MPKISCKFDFGLAKVAPTNIKSFKLDNPYYLVLNSINFSNTYLNHKNDKTEEIHKKIRFQIKCSKYYRN